MEYVRIIEKNRYKISLVEKKKENFQIKGDDFMNLIPCSENCKHQKDGYCCLEEYGAITDVISSPCAYFDERKETAKNTNTSKNKQ